MKNLKLILGPMRLPFVILAPACALVGLGAALYAKGSVNWLHFALVLIGAVAAHISVNAFNEYYDFKTGLDSRTQKTPFSGGSGTLQAHPELAPAALATALVAFAITGGIGLFFVTVWGWELIPLGVAGLFLLYGYTVWMARNPLLCLLAPGLGFGTFMVLGAHFALTGEYSWVAFAASLVPFFLVSDLLLLNQFPDVEADRSIGRRHYPILVGRKASGYIYIAFLLATYAAIVLGVILGVLPVFSLLGLLTLILAVPVIRNVLKNSDNVPALIPALGQNVLINLATPALLAVGLFIG
ncbi:MAG: 1 4-dihydroxy-2-naphthoate octaprenyltransferase [Anaerolineaceae bacterium]|nr:MAG: 1 4-dihydroxy-2-naphthoate octaprenyltransferase [Anaerolineaceae bacterium]